MKKIYFSMLLTMMLSMVSTTALAYDAEIDGIYYNFTGNEATVTNGSSYNYSGDVVIPERVTYDGTTYRVTSIGIRAFAYCTNLTSVVIPVGVISIGNQAFSGCSKLTAVMIPYTVKSIGKNAFSSCSKLSSITIPEDVTSIGDQAFFGCKNITSLAIPSGVTSIGESTFENCTGLTSLTLSEGLISIGKRALYGCSNLTAISIPKSVVEIGYYAFASCYGLTKAEYASIADLLKINFNGESNPLAYAHHLYINGEEVTNLVLPEGLTKVSDYAFCGCNALSSVYIPESVTEIGKWAFTNCSMLSSMVIPNQVTYIGECAFANCSGFPSINIPENVKYIGDSAFSGCSGITSLVIPESVKEIKNSAFSSCSKLISVTFPESLIMITATAFNYTPWYESQPDGVVYAGKLAMAYKGTMPNNAEIVFKDGTLGIGESLFAGSTKLISVTIPESLISMGRSAFYNCSNLPSVIIPNTVNEIGDQAFYGCSNLTSVTIDISTPLTITSSTFSNRANATLYVPYGSKSAYEEANYWKEFKEIIEFGGPEPTCSTPILTYQNGKIRCSCETEGVKYVYSITPTASTGESCDGVIELGTEFTVSVYATRDGYEDSEPATITIDLASVGDMNGDGVISIADVTGLVNVILGK